MRKWGVCTILDRTAPMGWRARSKGCGGMQGGEASDLAERIARFDRNPREAIISLLLHGIRRANVGKQP